MRFGRTVLALSCMLVAASGPAMASSTNGYGRITNVSGTSNGALLFTVETTFYSTATKSRTATSTRGAPPACGAGKPTQWAIDASTIAGQAAAQTLLWAAQNRRLISVKGSGQCTIATDTETVATFDIDNPD